MAIVDIDKGTGANTGTGTSARLAADIINANFAELKALIDALTGVTILGYEVDKNGNTDLENFEVGDIFKGWIESNTRWVRGKVVALPFDVDDDTKVKLVQDEII